MLIIRAERAHNLITCWAVTFMYLMKGNWRSVELLILSMEDEEAAEVVAEVVAEGTAAPEGPTIDG